MGPPIPTDRSSESSKRPRLTVQCFPAREVPLPPTWSDRNCTWSFQEEPLAEAEGGGCQWPTEHADGAECSGMVPIGMVPSLDSNSTPIAAAVPASVYSSSIILSNGVAFAPATLTTAFAPISSAPPPLSTTALAPSLPYSVPYSPPYCSFPFSLPSSDGGQPHGYPPCHPPSGDLVELSELPELSDEEAVAALQSALYSPRTLLEANRLGTGAAAHAEPVKEEPHRGVVPAGASEQTTQMNLASASASWYACSRAGGAGPAEAGGSGLPDHLITCSPGWVNQQLVAEDTSSWLPGVLSPSVQYAPQYLPTVSHCGTSSWCLSTATAGVPAPSPSGSALLLREMFHRHVLRQGLTRRPGSGKAGHPLL